MESLNDCFNQLKIDSLPNKGILVENKRHNGPRSNRASLCRHHFCKNAPSHEWAHCSHNRRGTNYKPEKQPPNNDHIRRGGRGSGNHHSRGNHGKDKSVGGLVGNGRSNAINKKVEPPSRSGISGNRITATRVRVPGEAVHPSGPVYHGAGGRGGDIINSYHNTTKKNNIGDGPPRGDNDSNEHWEGSRGPGSSYSASGRMPDGKPTIRLREVKLTEGLSFEYANDLRDACIRDGSMLQTFLDKIGFQGSLKGDDSKFDSSINYEVIVRRSPAAIDYSLVFESTRELNRNQNFQLCRVFAKHKATGFLEWLGGASKGWRFDSNTESSKSWKRRFVVQLNSLQGIFTLFARDGQKYFFVEEKKRMVWRKHAELTEIVSDIRVWIEILKSSDLTRRLLRNSGSGPDSPVHWAHHHPATDYPLTVVTESTMLELVEVSKPDSFCLDLISPL